MRVREIVSYQAYCDVCKRGTGPACQRPAGAIAFLNTHLSTNFHKENVREQEEEQEKESNADS